MNPASINPEIGQKIPTRLENNKLWIILFAPGFESLEFTFSNFSP